MKVTDTAHTDHGLTKAQMNYIAEECVSKDCFFIAGITLPEELGTVPCGLHGPEVGEPAIQESDVTYEKRGDRDILSRMCNLPAVQTSLVTVIGGPDKDGNHCVLYTAFGGPLAPREPGDETMNEEEAAASKEFWAQHALSK